MYVMSGIGTLLYSDERIRIEEVDPNISVNVSGAKALVQEPDDLNTIAIIKTQNMDTSSEDEDIARLDLVTLLLMHLEFASDIRAMAWTCITLGYTVREAYVRTEKMVYELYSARVKSALLRIVGTIAVSAAIGVFVWLLFGATIGAWVCVLVQICGHLSPWGVLGIFRKIDRDRDIERKKLFGNFC